MNTIDYRNRFKKNVEAYDELTRSKHVSLIYDLEKEVLVNLLAEIDSKQRTLMDFACGTGRWTQFLERHFKETTAVDVSKEMVRIAREKCRKTRFIITDITTHCLHKDLENKQFDVITAFRFYKNAEQPLREGVTKALPKYLKEGGYFISDLHLNTFSLMGILAAIIRLLKAQKFLGVTDLTVRTIGLNDIRKLFRNTPFDITDYYGMGILPGRANNILLPTKLLRKIEGFLTRRKILRPFAYNILVIARKKSDPDPREKAT